MRRNSNNIGYAPRESAGTSYRRVAAR